MKANTMIASLTILMTVAGFTVSAQENKEAKKARKDIKESQQDLREAKLDSAADYKKFQQDSRAKITDNQNKIAVLKSKKSGESQEMKDKYDNRIASIEKKNAAIKVKMDKCDKTPTSKWTDFKKEINHDIDEVGNDIMQFGKENTN